MQSFTSLTSKIIPLPINDIDTDQIIPAQYLKVTSKDGLVDGLFSRWKYNEDGGLNPDFPLNKPEYANAEILLAGDNFGCGSSREHAPWALSGWGIRAVISTSFADIFRNNALKNGLLPIAVDEQTYRDLLDLAEETTEAIVQVDLAAQTITLPGGQTASFPIDGFSKTCMLEGVDQLGYLLKQQEKITTYEQARAW
jgi:3-isopropylmalate/(R)-2-methylmalate dehydratase small subunit